MPVSGFFSYKRQGDSDIMKDSGNKDVRKGRTEHLRERSMAMPEGITLEKAKEMLDSMTDKAQEVMKDPSKVNDLLQQLEEKLKDIPYAGSELAKVPLMIAMIKSYVTKEYTSVSPKVVATMLGAVLYLVIGNDVIPDRLPVIGHLDDIAVFALGLKAAEPELNAFAAWREQNIGKI